MSKLYYYWQQTGGTDPWNPVHADSSIALLKPTFVTVLAIDTLLEDSPSREQIDACKYLGPMYFDLDAPDIADSIEGGQALLAKLRENGLKDSDIEIFLSGKKGLHFLIPMSVFCEKAVPTAKLPAIYKEMAFKLAVDTVDFRVYTARKGRMLRTCYNIRENGNYRVPITAAELETLTPESYESLCRVPRYVPPASPTYNPKFSLVFEAAQQKIASIKKRKSKVVDSNELKKQLPAVQQMLRGEALADVGFNKIAIQLAIFARESNWTEEQLVENAQGLCNNHQSDGRYNTPKRREAELRRMHSYIAENAAYEYDAGILRSCLRRETIELNTEYDEDGTPLSMDLTNGVAKRPGNYVVVRSEDELIISNFAMHSPKLLLDKADGALVAMLCKTTCGKEFTADSKDFTASSTLHNKISRKLLSFTGTDIHARSIYAIMIKEAKEESYLVDSEGLNIVSIPRYPNEVVSSKPFLAWASRDRVILPQHIEEQNINLTFQGFPDERGLFQTDLPNAPILQQWLNSDPENVARLNKFMKQTFACANRGTVAKILGWMVAAHYKPLFHAGFGKFPLLHVYGLAGLGKCLGIDTPVTMFDGTVKKVQDVQVGDKLLGPDGGVRNVLSLARGRETMYRVRQFLADDYVVNESHILSLQDEHGKVVNLPVKEYLEKSVSWRAVKAGWSVPGILKGDTTVRRSAITVQKLDVDDYYGFTIDGDHLFLLGDFTVTHNTEFTSAFLKLHYYRQEPASTTPSSTPYSFLSFVGGTCSIPILMDEWKPGSLNREIAEKYRAIFRDAYNMKDSSRGGGTRTIDKFNALSRVPLSAPISFIAEAAETETAIVERSVMVPFRRSGDIAQNAASMVYAEWSQETEILSILGREIAAGIMRNVDLDSFKDDFGKVHKWAVNKYRLVPGDDAKLAAGEITQAEYTAKSTTKDRPVYNNTVALFGLIALRKIVTAALGDAIDPEVLEEFRVAAIEVYKSGGSEASMYVSEYVKVLGVLSDMSRTTAPAGTKWLEEGIDFNLSELEGKGTVVIAARHAYNKYRQFCRTMGVIPMYPGDAAFEIALREVPSFIMVGTGTKTLDVSTVVFDAEALQRTGVPPFAGKVVALNR